jgi:NitT/TauT family transport system permease protein
VRLTLRVALPVALFMVALARGRRAGAHGQIPHYILPAPTLVAVTLWPRLGSLWGAGWVTMKITFGALALAVVGGVLLAVLFALSEVDRVQLFPYAMCCRSRRSWRWRR